MTWEFKPGMKVVCVDDNPKTYMVSTNPDFPLKRDQIYTLTWVGQYIHEFSKDHYLGVRVEGIKRAGNIDTPFHSNRFRPLQTQFTSLLNSIVAGVNDGKLVVEDTEYLEKRASKKRPVKASVEDEKYMDKFKKSQRKKVS